ncbi:hypothetical protein QBC32DRAFT_87678 [Pseudoneurospora amorphoporcata]|uniref:Uncharacterized protein n=1 Tax=Pseudoneurospora amorphoporcata TaxID=241081 RepID=A0AAN6SKJ5_9PEZI|nr:hypothetical protein QBC32DRAFT_87678 [Pseudoneurospora amorphoporcata]
MADQKHDNNHDEPDPELQSATTTTTTVNGNTTASGNATANGNAIANGNSSNEITASNPASTAYMASRAIAPSSSAYRPSETATPYISTPSATTQQQRPIPSSRFPVSSRGPCTSSDILPRLVQTTDTVRNTKRDILRRAEWYLQGVLDKCRTLHDEGRQLQNKLKSLDVYLRARAMHAHLEELAEALGELRDGLVELDEVEQILEIVGENPPASAMTPSTTTITSTHTTNGNTTVNGNTTNGFYTSSNPAFDVNMDPREVLAASLFSLREDFAASLSSFREALAVVPSSPPSAEVPTQSTTQEQRLREDSRLRTAFSTFSCDTRRQIRQLGDGFRELGQYCGRNITRHDSLQNAERFRHVYAAFEEIAPAVLRELDEMEGAVEGNDERENGDENDDDGEERNGMSERGADGMDSNDEI